MRKPFTIRLIIDEKKTLYFFIYIFCILLLVKRKKKKKNQYQKVLRHFLVDVYKTTFCSYIQYLSSSPLPVMHYTEVKVFKSEYRKYGNRFVV